MVVFLTLLISQTGKALERPSIRFEQDSKMEIDSDGKQTPHLNWETLKNAILPMKLQMILIERREGYGA